MANVGKGFEKVLKKYGFFAETERPPLVVGDETVDENCYVGSPLGVLFYQPDNEYLWSFGAGGALGCIFLDEVTLPDDVEVEPDCDEIVNVCCKTPESLDRILEIATKVASFIKTL